MTNKGPRGTRKGTRARKAPTPPDEGDEDAIDELHLELDPEALERMDPPAIEAQVTVDSVEYLDEDDEGTPRGPVCRVNMHVEFPEHVMQHLFAEHVQDGRISIEFLPIAPQDRRRDRWMGR